MSRTLDAAVRLPRLLAWLGEGGLDRQIDPLVTILTRSDLTEEVFGAVDDAVEMPLRDGTFLGASHRALFMSEGL